MRVVIGSLLALASCVAFGAAGWADEPAREPTQREFTALRETEVSPGQTEKAAPPDAIHDIPKEERAAIVEKFKNEDEPEKSAAIVIKGKVWKAETPQERDEHMRNLREASPPGTIFVIEIPSGNVWKFPPRDTGTDDAKRAVAEEFGFRYWTTAEYWELKLAGGPDTRSPDDRSGTEIARGPRVRERD